MIRKMKMKMMKMTQLVTKKMLNINKLNHLMIDEVSKKEKL